MDIPASLVPSFQQIFEHSPALVARAPGRVNLLGEHVDYNQGIVLPAAINRAVYLAASPTSDGLLTLHALDLNEHITVRLDQLEKPQPGEVRSPGWAAYPCGVAWALQQAGLAVTGMEVVYTSDVPIGSGLSSSAAVEVAFAAAWRALGGWQMDNLQLARLCQKAENQYVGVASGLMDQFASACGVQGHALLFDTRSLEWRPLELPAGTAMVVADSGMRRTLAGSAYNDRRAACEKAVALLSACKPGLQSLRDISAVEFAAYSVMLPDEVRRRAEHVVKEILRVEQAEQALATGNIQSFGGMMFACHKSLRDLYEVSIPELDALVEIARHLPGIYGARLTGAGFGGCTVNLIDASQAEAFIQGLQAGYEQHTGRQARVYLCQASSGVETESRRA